MLKSNHHFPRQIRLSLSDPGGSWNCHPPLAEPKKLSTWIFGMQKHQFELFRPVFPAWLFEESTYFLTFWKQEGDTILLRAHGLQIRSPTHLTRIEPIWTHCEKNLKYMPTGRDCHKIQLVESRDYIIKYKTHMYGIWLIQYRYLKKVVYDCICVYLSSCCCQLFNKGTALMLQSTCLKSSKSSLPPWLSDLVSRTSYQTSKTCSGSLRPFPNSALPSSELAARKGPLGYFWLWPCSDDIYTQSLLLRSKCEKGMHVVRPPNMYVCMQEHVHKTCIVYMIYRFIDACRVNF